MAKARCYIYHVSGACNPSDGVSRGVLQGDEDFRMKTAVEWLQEETATRPQRYIGPPLQSEDGKQDETAQINLCSSKKSNWGANSGRPHRESNGEVH